MAIQWMVYHFFVQTCLKYFHDQICNNFITELWVLIFIIIFLELKNEKLEPAVINTGAQLIKLAKLELKLSCWMIQPTCMYLWTYIHSFYRIKFYKKGQSWVPEIQNWNWAGIQTNTHYLECDNFLMALVQLTFIFLA